MYLKIGSALLGSLMLASCALGAFTPWDNAPVMGMTMSEVRYHTGEPSFTKVNAQGLTTWVYEYDVTVDEDGTRHAMQRAVTFDLGYVNGFEYGTSTSSQTTTTTSTTPPAPAPAPETSKEAQLRRKTKPN